MRSRNIKKQIWLDEDECRILQENSKKVGMKEAPYIRSLILGCVPKEKPDKEFYEVMKQLRGIGINLNQIAHRTNTLGYVESKYYQAEAEKWNAFIIDIKKKFLLPHK